MNIIVQSNLEILPQRVLKERKGDVSENGGEVSSIEPSWTLCKYKLYKGHTCDELIVFI